MKSFGERLREAREERHVTLDDIAEGTRIARRYLDALERSDLEILPGGAFDTGYIRSIAQFLDIDPQPVLEAYAVDQRQRGSDSADSEQQLLDKMSRLVDQRSPGKKHDNFLSAKKSRHLALVTLILGVMASASWLWFRSAPAVDLPVETALHTREIEPPSLATVPPEEEIAEPDSPVERTTDSGESPSDMESSAAQQPSSDISKPPTQAVLLDSPAAKRPTPNEPRLTIDPVGSQLAVSGSGVGTGIVERALVGKSNRFQEGTTVWFWTRVVGGENGEVLRHFWFYEGRTVRLSELTVGGHHWRTHSNYTIPSGSTGNYAVEARGLDGRVLARQEFVCLPTQKAQIQR